MLKSPCRPTLAAPGPALIQFQNSVMASMPPGCSMNSSSAMFSAPGGVVHQPRRHAQADLRPLRDLQHEQLADVDRATGARAHLDGQVGAVRKGAKAVAVTPGHAHLVEQAAGLLRVVLGPQPLPLRLVEAGGGMDGGLGRPAQAQEVHLVQLVAVQRQRHGAAEAHVVEQRAVLLLLVVWG